MKQWYTPLVATAYMAGMIYLTPYYYVLPVLVLLMMGYGWWWWRQSMGSESDNVRPLLGGMWFLILALPLIGYTFEYWWMQLQVGVFGSALLSLCFYYTLQLKGDFRVRPPAYRKLLQIIITVLFSAIALALASLGIVSVQTVGYWVLGVAGIHGVLVYWYVSALRVVKELRLASVLIQVIVMLPFWWVMSMLPFAPFTKAILTVTPALFMLGVERDRLLQEIDAKQTGLHALYVLVFITIILSTTRWS